jgi:hypothetical protein
MQERATLPHRLQRSFTDAGPFNATAASCPFAIGQRMKPSAPTEEAKHLPGLGHKHLHEVERTKRRRRLARVGLNPPPQVLAAPGTKPRAAGRRPQEARRPTNRRSHALSIKRCRPINGNGSAFILWNSLLLQRVEQILALADACNHGEQRLALHLIGLQVRRDRRRIRGQQRALLSLQLDHLRAGVAGCPRNL